MPDLDLAQLPLLVRFYVLRSLALDRRTAALSRWAPADRARFLSSKQKALPALARGGSARIRAGAGWFEASSALDLGSLQACLGDVHDELVVPGLLDPGGRPVVVDVGANVGQFTTAIKTFFPGAEILALEPDPDVHGRLAANTSAWSEVRTLNAAAGEAPGRLTLHRHHLSLMSTLRPGAVEIYDPANTVEVEVVTLDEITEDLKDIDLLKIDVEGFELEVLRGGRRTLGKTRLLMVELGLGRDDATSNLDVLAEIRAACPDARIVRFGRALGDPAAPICQDVLVQLHP